MTDKIIRRQITNQFFVHNCFGHLFRGILDWFGNDFYPRFEYKVIGTYSKSVEFFNKKKQLGHSVDTNLLPSITLDPNLDFSPEERGGRFLWQYATLNPDLGFRLNQSIPGVEEQDISIIPVFTRYQGTFEVIFWMSSVYELIDFRTMLLQFCGGFGRWIRPKYFWSYIILPDEIEQFRNDKNIPIDWGNTNTTPILVDTIKKYKRSVPLALDAMWRLDSFADQSTKYGGDTISEYKLSASFNYECNIPTYMVLNTKVGGTLVLGFSLGKVFTKYPLASPMKILKNASKEDNNIKNAFNNMKFFRINPKQTDEISYIEFDKESLTYPKKEDFVAWCPITKGKLVYIKSGMKYDDVQKGDIIFFDSYKEEYLPFIRKCSSIICHSGRIESPLFEKCKLLKKPLISDISDSDYNEVKKFENIEKTLDVLNRKLYDGLLNIEEITSDEVTGLGYEQLKLLKEKVPEIYEEAVDNLNESEKDFCTHVANCYLNELQKHMITDYADGVEKSYPLKFHVREEMKNRVRIYVNDIMLSNSGLIQYIINTETDIITFTYPPEKGSKIYSALQIMPIKDMKLLLIYNYTEEDLKRKSDDYIVIQFDIKEETVQLISSVYDIFVCSYCGVLQYEKDYEIDFEKKTLTLKIEPKEDEDVIIYQAVIGE